MDDNTAIVRRNRENSLKSTGPKTPAGKAIARRSPLRHGLRANPAALDGESRSAFTALHKRLVREFRPTHEIERQLVHRIAVGFWRLGRAAAIDGATSTLAVRDVAPLREQAQDWVAKVNACWDIQFVQVEDRDLLRQRRAEGRLGPEQMWVRGVRHGIRQLDWHREDMRRSGAGMTAMLTMLDDLVNGLTKWPHVFNDASQEQLAWVLGAPAASFWVVEPHHALPGEEAKGSRVLSLVREAQRRKAGAEIPRQLQTLIENRKAMLRQQRDLCAQRYTKQEESLRETAALLPDPKTLDQIIRYETHIERSLQRNIDQQARRDHCSTPPSAEPRSWKPLTLTRRSSWRLRTRSHSVFPRRSPNRFPFNRSANISAIGRLT